MNDVIHYGVLVDGALRSVVARALEIAARDGLPGDHHFYITFRTDHPGVRMARSLKARHPEDITIVIQNQFWDLEVDDDGFSIGLSFDRMPHELGVPWTAVTSFVDPSVSFGLNFASHEAEPVEEEEAEPPENDGTGNGGTIVSLDSFRKK